MIEPRARATDPKTSHQAAKRVNYRNQRGRTLLSIWKRAGATGPEVCPLNAQARLTELHDLGLIEPTGERNGARMWRCTEEGSRKAFQIWLGKS